jgi:multiple sugar transport system permease protein
MTGGGPAQPGGGGATEPVMLRIYNEGFVRPFQGSAAAMSVVVAIMIMVFSIANFKLFQTRN